MPDYTQTSTTGVMPWAEPYVQSYIQNAANLANTPYSQFQGQTVAPWNQNYTTANDLIYQTAVNSSPDVRAGRGAITNIAGGQYLNSNPWLSPQYTNQAINFNAGQMADAFARGTAAQTDAQYALSGAYGGSAWREQQAANAGQLAGQLGNMANTYQLGLQGMGSNAYQQGVNQMLGAAGIAPQMQQMDLQAAQALAGAGDMQRGYQQQLLDANQQEWARQQRYPYEQLNYFGSALGNNTGSTTTSSASGGSPSWLNYAGLGIAGLGLLGNWGR